MRAGSLRVALLLAFVTVAGAVVGRTGMARADEITVRIVEPSFLPQTWGYDLDTVTVWPGDIVTWVNEGDAPHTVTAADGSFDSGVLWRGDAWSLTPTAPGWYPYYCALHPDMRGLLIVAE